MADKFATKDEAAATAHLMAIRCHAKLVREKDDDPSRLPKQQPSGTTSDAVSEYEQLLDQHVARWPGSPSTETAGWWRAKLADQQGDWKRAAEQYAELLENGGNESHENVAAGPAVVRCYRQAVRNGTMQPEEVLAAINRWNAPELGAKSVAVLIATARLEQEHAGRLSRSSIGKQIRLKRSYRKRRRNSSKRVCY